MCCCHWKFYPKPHKYLVLYHLDDFSPFICSQIFIIFHNQQFVLLICVYFYGPGPFSPSFSSLARSPIRTSKTIIGSSFCFVLVWFGFFGWYCFVFMYTKFPDFILSYQRHKMPARSDQKKTQVGSQHRRFQSTWASRASAQS